MIHEAVLWAFLQNYHLDKGNACVHMAEVRFSPITFELLAVLMATWPKGEDITQEMREVRSAIGAYALDRGR